MNKRLRYARNVAIFLLILTTISYMLLSYVAFDLATKPPDHAAINKPSGEYRDVSFRSRGQNYSVYAFYLPGKVDAPALISTHGLSGSRYDEFQVRRAMALRDLGYTVLSIDLSDSTGDTVGNGRIAYGYEERWDVLGAFDYLIAQGFAANRIGLVGESMGATTSLLAAAAEPRIKAVWADSGYARLDSVMGERLQTNGLPPLLDVGFVIWDVLLTGAHLWEVTPERDGALLAQHQQAVYLIHDEGDSVVAFHHGRDLFAAYQSAGVDVTFWPIPKLEHVEGFDHYQQEYLKRLDEFFKANLRGESPA